MPLQYVPYFLVLHEVGLHGVQHVLAGNSCAQLVVMYNWTCVFWYGIMPLVRVYGQFAQVAYINSQNQSCPQGTLQICYRHLSADKLRTQYNTIPNGTKQMEFESCLPSEQPVYNKSKQIETQNKCYMLSTGHSGRQARGSCDHRNSPKNVLQVSNMQYLQICKVQYKCEHTIECNKQLCKILIHTCTRFGVCIYWPYICIYRPYICIYVPYICIYGPYICIHGLYICIYGLCIYICIYGPYVCMYRPYVCMYRLYICIYKPYLCICGLYICIYGLYIYIYIYIYVVSKVLGLRQLLARQLNTAPHSTQIRKTNLEQLNSQHTGPVLGLH